ncbi:MAG TPA: hypothetical protein PLX71_09575 [Phycicoccus sp.]|nr:hypothetical protein [Phycicoccus sp.]
MSFATPPPPVTTVKTVIQEPSVGVMWINAFLSWAIMPLLYLLYLTIRNIAWATSNKRPWFRYAAPLLTVIIVGVGGFVLLLVWASSLPSTRYGY